MYDKDPEMPRDPTVQARSLNVAVWILNYHEGSISCILLYHYGLYIVHCGSHPAWHE